MRQLTIAILVLALIGGATALTVGPFRSYEDATDPVFYNTLGYQLAEEGFFEEAQGAFTQAVALDPGYENARSNLAVAAFRNQDYLTGIEQMTWLVGHDSSNKAYHFDLAQNLVHQARYVDADISKLELAIEHFELAGTHPHAAENAQIVKSILADVQV